MSVANLLLSVILFGAEVINKTSVVEKEKDKMPVSWSVARTCVLGEV